MGAIYRRELKNYFVSPIAYVFLGVFYLFSGIFLYFLNLSYAIADIPSIINNMFTVVIFLVPLITMRIFTEDRRNKTDQALITAPVTTGEIVLGKYFAALTVYLIGCMIYVLYAIILSIYAKLMWGTIFSSILGIILVGAATIAIGSFISCLTENQVIAGIGSFGLSFLISLIDSIGSAIGNEFLSKVITSLSFSSKFIVFTQGQVNLSHILFFISVVALFLYYSARSIDRRRYIA